MKYIFIGGTGWSGSSAVHDFLLNYSNVIESEVGEQKIIAGLVKIYNFKKGQALFGFRLGKIMANPDLHPLTNFNVFSLRDLIDYLYTKLRVSDSMVDKFRDTFNHYIKSDYKEKYINEIQKIQDDCEFGILTDLIKNIVEEIYKSDSLNSLFLIDNALNANNYEIINEVMKKMNGEAISILVIRNPLDQYSDLKTFANKKLYYIFHFCFNYLRSLRSVKGNTRIVVVKFEDFILSQHVRLKIIQRINVQEEKSPLFYNPIDSTKNIDIWRGNLSIIERMILMPLHYLYKRKNL